jgi:hypothetical protein
MIHFVLAVLMLFIVPLYLALLWDRLGFGKWGMVLSLLGTISNVVAVVANGWQMPVIGYYIEPGTMWKTGVDAELPWICDRFPIPQLGIASIGDFFIFAGAAVFTTWFICSVIRRFREDV